MSPITTQSTVSSKSQKGNCSPDYRILSPYVPLIPHIRQQAIKTISRTDRLQTANLNFTLLINSKRMNTTRSFILLSYQIFTFNTIMLLSFILWIKCAASLYLTACFKLLFACSELPVFLLEEYGMSISCVHKFQGPILFKSISNKACQIVNL